MAQAQIRDTAGGVVSTLELNDAVFGVERNDTLIHQAVLRIHANRRRGTHDTKTRGEVNGTTAKWYRQKGTGRARHGAQTAPQFRKGGVVFGPHPRSYRQDMPQKMRRKALCSVLSDKLSEGRIHVIAGFDFTVPRTKDMVAVLNVLGVSRRILIVLPAPDPNVTKSARNIPGVRTIVAHTLNVVDAIDSDHLIFTQAALNVLEGVLTGHGVPQIAVAEPEMPESATVDAASGARSEGATEAEAVVRAAAPLPYGTPESAAVDDESLPDVEAEDAEATGAESDEDKVD
ncbi:MAG TPA: 50S ribosomal protein L4 [Chloroflexota bacterium]|nr:50S ribosomal protein L4 [Chloroflexota bacterium]